MIIMDVSPIVARHHALIPNGSLGNAYVQAAMGCCRLIVRVVQGAHWVGVRPEVQTVADLGVRAINLASAQMHNASAGYWAPAVHCSRDLLETAQLLEYFRYYPDQIAPWVDIEDEKRHRTYGFSKVASALLKARGETSLYYREGFNAHSNLGSHASAGGLALHTDETGRKQIGPTYNARQFRLNIAGAWGNLLLATGQFMNTIDALSPAPKIAERYRYEVAVVEGGADFFNNMEEADLGDWFSGKINPGVPGAPHASTIRNR